jgi:methyl-accepting chemotaxis protein
MRKLRSVDDLPVRVKLFAVVSVLVVALVGFFVVYFPARQIKHLDGTLERKARSFSHILAFQVRSAVAFDDKETAREAFEGAAIDPDVSFLVLFDESGSVLQAQGKGEVGTAPAWSDTPRLEERPDVVRVIEPVASLEGPKGTLIVELSKTAIQHEASAVARTALGVGLVALVIGCCIAWAVGTSFSRRIARLAVTASAVARGDLATPPLADDSRDELGQLAASFNTMLANLKTLVMQIADASAHVHSAADGILDASRRQEEGAARQSGAVDQGRATVEALAESSRDISLAIADVLSRAEDNQSQTQELLREAMQSRIAHLLEEQKAATEESTFVMDAVADVAQETVESCSGVVRSASELRRLSASLNELIGGFKLEPNAAHEGPHESDEVPAALPAAV